MTTSKPGLRLLIGYDGSDCAKAAIFDLRRAGVGDAGAALVVAVADVAVALAAPVMVPSGGEGIGTWDTGIGPSFEIRAKAEARAEETARDGAAVVSEALPGWSVRSEAAIDSPYWGLIRVAETWRPDLVVVGSHGRSVFGRVLLGSVSGYVLSHAPCSVRVGRPCPEPGRKPAPAGAAGSEPAATSPTPAALRIIVGADGSDGGRAALDTVCSRSWPADTEVRVVTAVDERLSTTFAVYAAWLADREPRVSGIRQALDSVVDDLHSAGLKASAVVLQGDPKRVLVEVAEQWRADCIFLGAKGHSRLERFLLGSVSAAVAARAPCSVEVVR
jgi:nucleotide-binding universal stress UspA family protein